MEVTKEQIIEMMRTAYLCGHQDTVDGNVAYCEQGSREVCEDIFESDFEQSQETRTHETVVIFSDSQKERIQELLTDQRINCLNAFQTCDEPQAIGAAIMNAKEPDFDE